MIIQRIESFADIDSGNDRQPNVTAGKRHRVANSKVPDSLDMFTVDLGGDGKKKFRGSGRCRMHGGTASGEVGAPLLPGSVNVT